MSVLKFYNYKTNLPCTKLFVKEEKHETEYLNKKANNQTANIEDKTAAIRGSEEFICTKKREYCMDCLRAR